MRPLALTVCLLFVGCSDPRTDDLLAKQAELEIRIAELEGHVSSLQTNRSEQRETSMDTSWITPSEDGVVLTRSAMPELVTWRRMGRLLPDETGARFRRVRAGSPLAAMGFTNGDVLVSLNGEFVAPAIGIAGLRSVLTTADDVHVEIDRRGEPMSWTIRVQ